ncbi:MAG TPA: potassium-transporting ATPase subunit KdpA [Arthrobacter sp.]|nr:potassium-transporting ATPase subunit KdpA [Arthrobacter sp.]
MARVYTAPAHLRAERVVYRLVRVDPDSDQRWTTYAAGVLGFSAVSIVLLYLLQRVQSWLPLSLGRGNVEPGIAFNTAVSFVTNTNWQSYVPETVLGHFVQMAGSPCRTSSPRRWAWPCSLHRSGGSCAAAPTGWATSGSTSLAERSGSCCRSRYSERSCC